MTSEAFTPSLPGAPGARPERDYDARRLVRERLSARRRRVRALRRRVAVVVIAAFMALWIGIYVQLATGHDPALVANATRRAAATTAATGTATKAAAATTSVVSTPSSASTGGSSSASTSGSSGPATTGSSSAGATAVSTRAS